MSVYPKYDVTGFGELMLRMSVPAGARLDVADKMDVHVGGAEGNVLANISSLGRKCAWVGGLPNNPLGRIVRNHLWRSNVNTDGVIWRDGARMGLYFIEFSGPPRGTHVYYDRADSAAVTVGPKDLPLDLLLNTKVVHLTGITPALSQACLESTKEIIREARARGVRVSFDVNFRSKLWDAKTAAKTLKPIVQGVDLLLCGRSDAMTVFGCPEDPEECVKALLGMSGAKSIVVSLSDEGAIAWDGKQLLRAEQRPLVVIDRIGAGDAMAAGVLHGWLDGDLQRGLEYGMAMAGIALSVHGDTVITTPEEVEGIMAAGHSARPNR